MQTNTHIKAWNHEDSPLLWVETIYIGDTEKMPEYVGFSHDGHYFVSRDQLVTCYLNKKTLEQAAAFGEKKYRDSDFIERFIKQTGRAEVELGKVVQSITQGNLGSIDNDTLLSLYGDFVDSYSLLIGLYRFIRPEFYESVVEKGGVGKSLKRLGELRFKMHRVWLEAFNKAEVFFKEVGRRLDLSALEVTNSTSREINDFLKGERSPDKEEIQRRIHGHTLRYEEDGFSITLLEDSRLGGVFEVQGKSLKGQSAYSGVVQGEVFVIAESLRGASAKEMQHMKKGQILVTEMTSPDMMPAIKKAAAIITNHGGTLCHAAIISREMKIPCVVGTEDAARILKDGDMVEVNAEDGVVQVLSSDE